MNDSDRRRSARVPINTAFSETDPRTTTPVSNLSETGVFMFTDQLYPLGSHIELRFAVFPENPELFVHTGRVTRHSHEPPGMGIAFDPMPPELKVMVERILAYASDAARRKSSHRRTRSKRFVFGSHDLRTKLLDE